MLRIRVTRSMTLARLGKTSLICRPGTDVAIGLNSPRTSAGGLRLGVERVEVRRAAGQPDQDAVLDLRRHRLGLRPGHGAEPEPVVEAQPEEAQRTDPKDLAAARAAARLPLGIADIGHPLSGLRRDRPVMAPAPPEPCAQWLNANSREFNNAQKRSSAASRSDEACFSSADQRESSSAVGGRQTVRK